MEGARVCAWTRTRAEAYAYASSGHSDHSPALSRPLSVRCGDMAQESSRAHAWQGDVASRTFLMDKVRVKSISLNRAEGCTRALEAKTVTSFEAADAVLREWARTAPEKAGCHKVDFKVTWQDGETYEGRYDLVRADTSKASLATHMREFCSFHGGLWCPSHMPREQYEEFIEQQERVPGGPKRMEFVRLLERYALDGTQERGPQHRYTLMYRPPSFATLPPGWMLVERPQVPGFERRQDLERSSHRFGVVAYERPLTDDEVTAYELTPV